MEICEFHKSKVRNKIKEACNIGDAVLIQEDITPRINLRVGIIDSFMTSRDGIKIMAIVRYLTNGKTPEIRCPINKFYLIETMKCN